MRHTELHSTVTILCQSVTIGPGTRGQGLGKNCEFVGLRSGVHEVAVLLGFEASSVPRKKATIEFDSHGSVHRSMNQ